MTTWRSAVHGLLACAGLSVNSPAQQVTASAAVAVLDYRVNAGFGTEQYRGPAVVGGAEIQIVRRLRVSLDVATGRLPAQEGGDLDRDFGEAALELIVPITSWLGTRTGVVVRSYSSDIARTRQTMLRLGGEARFGLVEGVVQGALRFAYLPGVWVDGLDAPNLAFTSSAILDYALGPGRVRFSYSLERLDYPASGGASRDEQLSGLWLGFMLPFGAPGVRGNR